MPKTDRDHVLEYRDRLVKRVLAKADQLYIRDGSLPVKQITVKVHPANQSEATLYRVAIEELEERFDKEVHRKLEGAGYKLRDDLSIQHDIGDPPDGEEGKESDIEIEVKTPGQDLEEERRGMQISISVREGEAVEQEYDFEGLHKIRIGRGKEHQVQRDLVPRVNDICFLDPKSNPSLGEEENRANRRVSRQHATLVYSEDHGGYLLQRDGSGYEGKLVHVRNGEATNVVSKDQGVTLRDGDHVLLGKGGAKLVVSPP
jgi:pSer/pThr/pTyr-binding forkhead associated (FHA) protein